MGARHELETVQTVQTVQGPARATQSEVRRVVNKLQFPNRKIFGSMSATVSNERQRELQTYLNRLIATGCKLSSSPLYKEQTRESLARFAPFFLTNNSDDLHF